MKKKTPIPIDANKKPQDKLETVSFVIHIPKKRRIPLSP